MQGSSLRRSLTRRRQPDRKRRTRRLQADAMLLAENYPDLKLKRTDESDAFVGCIHIGSASGITIPIEIRIELPARYPEAEPEAVDSASRFTHEADAHFFPDGTCCLWLPWESPWNGRGVNAIVEFMDQVAAFFFKQLIFEANGRKSWPGPARSHSSKGYQEFVCEMLGIELATLGSFLPVLADWRNSDKFQLCPCGRAQLRDCHGPAIESLMKRVGRSRVEGRASDWKSKGIVLGPSSAGPNKGPATDDFRSPGEGVGRDEAI
jgi:hypothetical protein